MEKNPHPGKFILFEGLDGSGKTTQEKLLYEFLTERGKKVLLTKEYTLESEEGQRIRRILHQLESASPAELQELFAKDRKAHLTNTIIPALAAGMWVVCDKYFFTSFAYGTAEGLDLEWLIILNHDFLLPDITFLLQVRPEVCIARIEQRGEKRTLFEEEQKLKRVWEVYLTLPNRFENMYLIDGEQVIERVAKKIQNILINQVKWI